MEASTLISMLEQKQIVHTEELIAFIDTDTDVETLLVALGTKNVHVIDDRDEDNEEHWQYNIAFPMFQAVLKYAAVHQPDVAVKSMVRIGKLDRLEESWNEIANSSGTLFKDIFLTVQQRTIDEHIVPSINKVLGEYKHATIVNFGAIPPHILSLIKNEKMFIQDQGAPATNKTVSLLAAIRKSDLLVYTTSADQYTRGISDEDKEKGLVFDIMFSISKSVLAEWLLKKKNINLNDMLDKEISVEKDYYNKTGRAKLRDCFAGYQISLIGNITSKGFVVTAGYADDADDRYRGALRDISYSSWHSEHGRAAVNKHDAVMRAYCVEYMQSKQYAFAKDMRVIVKHNTWEIE